MHSITFFYNSVLVKPYPQIAQELIHQPRCDLKASRCIECLSDRPRDGFERSCSQENPNTKFLLLKYDGINSFLSFGVTTDVSRLAKAVSRYSTNY